MHQALSTVVHEEETAALFSTCVAGVKCALLYLIANNADCVVRRGIHEK